MAVKRSFMDFPKLETVIVFVFTVSCQLLYTKANPTPFLDNSISLDTANGNAADTGVQPNEHKFGSSSGIALTDDVIIPAHQREDVQNSPSSSLNDDSPLYNKRQSSSQRWKSLLSNILNNFNAVETSRDTYNDQSEARYENDYLTNLLFDDSADEPETPDESVAKREDEDREGYLIEHDAGLENDPLFYSPLYTSQDVASKRSRRSNIKYYDLDIDSEMPMSKRSTYFNPIRLYTTGPPRRQNLRSQQGVATLRRSERARARYGNDGDLRTSMGHVCNLRRVTVEMLLEYFTTGKICGSNVVRIRFGLG